MQVVALILGILAMLGMLVGLIPFLGWSNWFVIPFAGVGVIISIIAIATARGGKGLGIAGLVLCLVALLIAIPRLIIGGGIL